MAGQPGAPGWYRRHDWSKLETYFDGRQWTDDTRDPSGEVAQSVHARPSASPQAGPRPDVASGSFVAKPRPEGAASQPLSFGDLFFGLIGLAVIGGAAVWFLSVLFGFGDAGEPPRSEQVTAAQEESRTYGLTAGITLSTEGNPRTREACDVFWVAIKSETEARSFWVSTGGDPDLVTDHAVFMEACQSM